MPEREVGIMLYEGCQQAMVHGITDLFAIASEFSAARGGQRVRTSHWAREADGNFVRAYDTQPLSASGEPMVVIVPGRLTGPASREEAMPFARWLHGKHMRGTTLASNCGGAFILAETGLLDGRPATTHWQFARQFQERFPQVLVDPDRIVIDDGDLITAGGLMAWTDLGLRLVDRLLGATVTIETAKFLLIDPAGREQRHYSSFAPRLTHGDESILKLQHWLHTQAGRPTTIAEMAGTAGLEERTLQRRFKAATGMKPTEYVQHVRVSKARELLEFTRRPVDQVAWSVGYEDPTSFRRTFHRILGLTPGDYRARFHSGADIAAAA